MADMTFADPKAALGHFVKRVESGAYSDGEILQLIGIDVNPNVGITSFKSILVKAAPKSVMKVGDVVYPSVAVVANGIVTGKLAWCDRNGTPTAGPTQTVVNVGLDPTDTAEAALERLRRILARWPRVGEGQGVRADAVLAGLAPLEPIARMVLSLPPGYGKGFYQGAGYLSGSSRITDADLALARAVVQDLTIILPAAGERALTRELYNTIKTRAYKLLGLATDLDVSQSNLQKLGTAPGAAWDTWVSLKKVAPVVRVGGARVGDAAGVERYAQVRDALTKLLYYEGKDVPVDRAVRLVGLLTEFEQEIIKRGPGIIKGDLAGTSISNDEYNDASKINWWRTKGLPAMKPTEIIPSGKYALEIYGPALNVINAGAFLANAQPTVIERLYVAMEPVTKELAKVPAGVVEAAAKMVGDMAKGAAKGAAESLGTTGLLVAGGAALLAVIVLLKR